MCLPGCGLLSATVILIGLASASAGTADKTALLTSHPANSSGGHAPICSHPYKGKHDIILVYYLLCVLEHFKMPNSQRHAHTVCLNCCK